MQYRKLGKSNLNVSTVSLGCWAIGGPAWRDGQPVGWSGNDDAESINGLRKAYELGINHWDTADVYGDGHSERLIGQVLKDIPREDIVLASKVGWVKGTAEHFMQPIHLRHQLEQTLQNLGTDYLDIYYFHHADFGPNDMYLEEAADLMRQFQKEGKIRVIGQSAYSYKDFMRVCPITKPEVLQFQYTAFGNEYDNDETNLFAWADEQDLGLVLFGPLAQGLLLDKFDPENPPTFDEGDMRQGRFTKDELLRIRKKLQPLKEHFGGTTQGLVQMAIQFALSKSKNACTIPGFKNERQVISNAEAADAPALTNDEVSMIINALQK